jgi:hypothetical protein
MLDMQVIARHQDRGALRLDHLHDQALCGPKGEGDLSITHIMPPTGSSTTSTAPDLSHAQGLNPALQSVSRVDRLMGRPVTESKPSLRGPARVPAVIWNSPFDPIHWRRAERHFLSHWLHYSSSGECAAGFGNLEL